ncbi:MAG: PPA1309 family protein [Actinomycetota bacterium]|nr:PPA1309 family protein [Actinomycetota bacterium]
MSDVERPAPGRRPTASILARALPGTAREVEQFVAAGGWDQPPHLFALVPTHLLLESRPALVSQLDAGSTLTPVAQEPLPEGERSLESIEWPETVAGCALVREIVVLPPEAEEELGGLPEDPEEARRAVVDHPGRQEARLVAAVLRNGTGACLLRVRGAGGVPPGEDADEDQLIERNDLAPNLIRALLATLR